MCHDGLLHVLSVKTVVSIHNSSTNNSPQVHRTKRQAGLSLITKVNYGADLAVLLPVLDLWWWRLIADALAEEDVLNLDSVLVVLSFQCSVQWISQCFIKQHLRSQL